MKMVAPIIDRHRLKLIFVCAFFVSCNFVPFLIPLILVLSYKHWWCRIAVAIAIMDLVIPLRPGPKGSWKAFTEWCNITQGIRSYHNAEVIVEGEYRKDKNYLVCYLPHALYPYAFWLIYDTLKERYKIRFMYTGADVLFWVPILRRIHTFWGCTSVSYQRLKENLHQPYPFNTLMLQPDGIRGMFYGIEHEQIVINRRRGFCRVALQTGASLVPSICLVQTSSIDESGDLAHEQIGCQRKKESRLFTGRVVGVCHSDLCHAPPNSWLQWEHRFHHCKPRTPRRIKLMPFMLHLSRQSEDLYDRYKHKMGPEWARSHDRLYLENQRLPTNVKED